MTLETVAGDTRARCATSVMLARLAPFFVLSSVWLAICSGVFQSPFLAILSIRVNRQCALSKSCLEWIAQRFLQVHPTL